MTVQAVSFTLDLGDAAVLLAALSHAVHESRCMGGRPRLELVLQRLGRQWNERMEHIPVERRYPWPTEDAKNRTPHPCPEGVPTP
jgi:hypothetical protein